MRYSHKAIACDYYLNYSTLSVDTSHRDLGVVFSEDLKWGPHHKLITSRSYKILGLLRRIFTKFSCVQSKRVLYITLVKPHLLYCSPLWHPYLLSDIKLCRGELLSLSLVIIHLTTRSVYYCNLLPLMMEYEIRDILLFIKCVKANDLPFNIHEFITFNTTTTRSATFFKLLHSRPRNRIQSNEYFNRFPRLWNSLPLSISSFLSLH